MIERAEKERLETDLGDMLSHNYDQTANNLDSLKKWLKETLHELKLSNERLNTSHQELKFSHQELQMSINDIKILNQEMTIAKQELKISDQKLKRSNIYSLGFCNVQYVSYAWNYHLMFGPCVIIIFVNPAWTALSVIRISVSLVHCVA